jgi:diguanylate cyclase (GGDEF)-like protein
METPETQHLVLLVDDDPVTLLLTESALQERGLKVVAVESGQAALDAYAAYRPDIVLLDALMPGLDGFETCLRLRLAVGGEDTPILMLTGLDDDQSVARAYEVGATDFFVKTSRWTHLSQRIRYLLRAARMREELSKSRAKVAKAQRIARLGHWEWDLASNAIYPSEECCRILDIPYGTESIVAEALWEKLWPADREALAQRVNMGLKRGTIEQLECRVDAQPAPRIINIEAEVEYAANGSGEALRVHGVIQDITERREAEDRIRHLANYDSLTGLANRLRFRDQVAAALEKARHSGQFAALLLIDLDRFKQINDTLGHNIGDLLLKEVASRLLKYATDSRYVSGRISALARLGGDEFTVLVTGIGDAEEALRIAEDTLDELRAPVQVAGHEFIQGASIGLAMFPRDGMDFDELLRNADRAMYAAKENGRSVVCRYAPSLNTRTPEKFVLESALYHALERGQLLLHYQPQIDARSGRIIGVEALMRWRLNGKLISPGEFIPMAIETGLIVDMEQWAIMSACWQNHLWRESGLEPIPIAVNITTSHFQSSSLGGVVKAALEDSEMEARYLEMEITESVLMRDIRSAMPQLDALTSMGVKFSVDDFGTGYSSLSYLRRLPLDTLKIDRSFVSEIGVSSDSESIIAAILAMARSLNLRVIAEGVETRAQMDALAAQGCYIMQGFYFCKPMAAMDLQKLMHDIEANNGRDEWSVAGKSNVMSLRRGGTENEEPAMAMSLPLVTAVGMG